MVGHSLHQEAKAGSSRRCDSFGMTALVERGWRDETDHAEGFFAAPSRGARGLKRASRCEPVGGTIQLMSEDAIEILKKALALPVAERAEVAGSLIESLDEAEDGSVETAWEIEIIRRMKDLDSGKAMPVSLEEARRRLSSAIE